MMNDGDIVLIALTGTVNPNAPAFGQSRATGIANDIMPGFPAGNNAACFANVCQYKGY